MTCMATALAMFTWMIVGFLSIQLVRQLYVWQTLDNASMFGLVVIFCITAITAVAETYYLIKYGR